MLQWNWPRNRWTKLNTLRMLQHHPFNLWSGSYLRQHSKIIKCKYQSMSFFSTGFHLQSKYPRNGKVGKLYKLELWRRTFLFPEYRLIKTTWRKGRGFWSLLFYPPSVSLSSVSSFWSHLYAERIWNLCKIFKKWTQ